VPHTKQVRVLIADPSSFVRLVLSDMLAGQPGITFVGAAPDGIQLIQMAKHLKPDVILLNPKLPRNNRMFALERLASECPARVVFILGQEESGPEKVHQFRHLGVMDYISWPGSLFQTQIRQTEKLLLLKLKAASLKPLVEVQKAISVTQLAAEENLAEMHAIVLGASTGGAMAIEQIIRSLPATYPHVVLIALHMPAGFTRRWISRLQSFSQLRVTDVRKQPLLKPGMVVVAAGGSDMIVQRTLGSDNGFRAIVPQEASSEFDTPSVDRLMNSVSIHFRERTVGVILSGMGVDGTNGLRQISQWGGQTIAQSQETAVVHGMASSAIRQGVVNSVLSLEEIISQLKSIGKNMPGQLRQSR
jgi:two-component system chemotaxis response regulator CheB